MMPRRIRIISTLGLYLIFILFNSYVFADTNNGNEPKHMSSEKMVATFAGGCFWCMEPPFDAIEGVIETVVGYTGGHQKAPGYEQVSAGVTGHTEAIQITFDPNKTSYKALLEVFWRNIDPTTPNRQFCDVGSQYRPAIFVHDQQQRAIAEQSKAELEQTKTFPEPIAVAIAAASEFFSAEDYHQDYYKKNPVRYKFYRYSCGRDKRLQQLWGKEAKQASHE